MTVFDLDALVLKNRLLTALTALRYRKSDRLQWPVRFLQGDSFVELPSGAGISVGIKRTRADTSYLALATNPAKTGSGSTATYTFDLNLNTEPVVAALATSDTIECFLEVEVVTDAQRLTSQAIPLTLEQDIITGGAAPVPVLAALGGGGFLLKQSSFTAEPGKAYLVGVGPNSGGGSSGEGESGSGEGEGEGDSGYGSIGSAETEIIITLPANPQPADAIVILDAFGNWSPTSFGQSTIPALLGLNGQRLNGDWCPLYSDNPNGEQANPPLPCSSILTFSGDTLGWRITRIETGRRLDLGYNSTIDLCNQYPDGVLLHNARGEAYPRFIVRHSSGHNVSLGMAYGNPVIEPSDSKALRIGQQPLPIRTSGFETIAGLMIQVPLFNTDTVAFGPNGAPQWPVMAVFKGTVGPLNPAQNEPGTIYYDSATGTVKLLVQNPRPLTITLSGTSHNVFANTFDLNGNYYWAGGYYQHEEVYPARIRRENNRWGIYVDANLYARAALSSSAVYPSKNGFVAQATDDETDFVIGWDEMLKRYVTVGGSE